MRDSQKKANKAYRLRTLSSKKHYCEECCKSFRDKYTLTNHMKSRIHNPLPKKSYYCECCDYRTKFKPSMRNHLKSKKHIKKSLD
jgi:hypothetical protein